MILMMHQGPLCGELAERMDPDLLVVVDKMRVRALERFNYAEELRWRPTYHGLSPLENVQQQRINYCRANRLFKRIRKIVDAEIKRRKIDL